MSRVAKLPVTLPAGVSVSIEQQNVSIKGGKGVLQCALHSLVDIKQDAAQIQLSPKDSSSAANMQAATARALINNCVIGVSKGFSRKLLLIGVGYRAQLQDGKLNLSLGFSHPIIYVIPEGISIEIPTQTEILITGIDKQKVGQTAADIRGYRPPEPYKGKGVRYEKEVIILKETKKK
jgi:large subunit ribosomal protein L6